MAFSLRSITEDIDYETATYRPYLNTGNSTDIISGKFVPTVDGGWAISGGLGAVTSYIAEANRHKSSLANGGTINAMARWKESLFYNYDTEGSTLDNSRILNMSNRYLDDPVARAAHIEDLDSRFHPFDASTSRGENLDAWFDFIKEIRDAKIKRAKDLTVETELIDIKTGKPYMMLFPTFMGIDSWTEAMVRQVNVKNEEFDADTEMSKQRTINMEESWQKARLMRQLPAICAKAGIYMTITGHLGKKLAVGNTPNKKDMAFMGQDEKANAMSNRFYFLMSTIFKISNSRPKMGTDKAESEFPSEYHVSGNELQELDLTMIRCKNSSSGKNFQMISSQSSGPMVGLSFYNSLRNNKYFGLGNPNKTRSPLLGDLNIGRTKIHDLSKEYKVQRALELTCQLFMIQTTWDLSSLKDSMPDIDFGISVESFAERLMGNNSISIDDVLNSRGWWTYKEAKEERQLLSLPDILAILGGTYRPKFLDIPKPKI